MTENLNCDGPGPHNQTSLEVRILNIGGDSNAILCLSCFARAMLFRKRRNKDLLNENQFKIPEWSSLKIYLSV